MARRKTRTKKDQDLSFLQQTLDNDNRAYIEGPKVKKFSLHDLRNIKPLTFGQQQLFQSYFQGNYIVANGSAGTGKSFCAAYLALSDILDENTPQDHIIIVRSAAASRNLGFLPGTIEEKMAPFEEPYKDIFSSLLKKHDAYDSLKAVGRVKFMSTSFVRGLTWDNAVVIVDEMQNCQFHEINSIVTRLGDNSKLVVCGDVAQNDLVLNKNEISGYARALDVFAKMQNMDIINFTRDDIVRSQFVKSWICAVEDTP